MRLKIDEKWRLFSQKDHALHKLQKNAIVFYLAQSNQLLGLRKVVRCTAPCSVKGHDLAASEVE